MPLLLLIDVELSNEPDSFEVINPADESIMALARNARDEPPRPHRSRLERDASHDQRRQVLLGVAGQGKTRARSLVLARSRNWIIVCTHRSMMSLDRHACPCGRPATRAVRPAGPVRQRIAFDHLGMVLRGRFVALSLSASSLRTPPRGGRNVLNRRPAVPRHYRILGERSPVTGYARWPCLHTIVEPGVG